MTRRTAGKILLFDLDGTLYPNSNPYRQHVHKQLFEFMHEHLGMPRETPAETVWRPLFQKYHQSERAFRAQGWEFDHAHYWRYIRGNVKAFLTTDPQLDHFLSSLPSTSPKYIFTNAREEQAEETLDCLGIKHHFLRIFGADFMTWHMCKPEKEAFEKVLEALPKGEDGKRPASSEIVLFEDSVKNLMMAKELGIRTILIDSEAVGEEGRSHEDFHHFDAVVSRLTLDEVQKVAPFLWEEGNGGQAENGDGNA